MIREAFLKAAFGNEYLDLVSGRAAGRRGGRFVQNYGSPVLSLVNFVQHRSRKRLSLPINSSWSLDRRMHKQMSKMLNILPDKCTGCMQCELACSWVQTGSFQPSQSLIRVNVFDEEASYAPYSCIQCDEAWCMNACPVNAIAIDDATGAKIILDSLCIGCHLCTIACPFGTVWTLPETDKAAKCNLCGGDPACVSSCPTDAIQYVDAGKSGDWFADWGKQVASSFAEAKHN